MTGISTHRLLTSCSRIHRRHILKFRTIVILRRVLTRLSLPCSRIRDTFAFQFIDHSCQRQVSHSSSALRALGPVTPIRIHGIHRQFLARLSNANSSTSCSRTSSRDMRTPDIGILSASINTKLLFVLSDPWHTFRIRTIGISAGISCSSLPLLLSDP